MPESGPYSPAIGTTVGVVAVPYLCPLDGVQAIHEIMSTA